VDDEEALDEFDWPQEASSRAVTASSAERERSEVGDFMGCRRGGGAQHGRADDEDTRRGVSNLRWPGRLALPV
jgi:hypothetical protein